jgi:hypothetical protein
VSIDDAPMDELDMAIAREAAALRAATARTAQTDLAWEEFEAVRKGTRLIVTEDRGHRGRWAIAVAAGLVAATVSTLVILQQIREPAPTDHPDITTPAPSTLSPTPTTAVVPASSSDAVVVSLTKSGDLVASGSDGTQHVLGQVPAAVVESEATHYAPGATPYLHAFVSATGWVAVTGVASEGFWFFDLNDPSREARFVALEGPPGGHESQGSWNPAGTLFAAVELSRTAAIIDPATGELTKLDSTDPPVGYPPTWTADGSGILTGAAAPACVTGATTEPRSLAIAPITGEPELASVPALADGRNHVAGDGIWSNDNRCGADPQDGSLAPLTDVVVVGPTGAQTWIDGSDVAPAVVKGSVFASTRPTLWALTGDDGSRQMALYEVSSPHTLRVVNAVVDGVIDGSFAFISAVAPDDSAVVVLMNGPGGDQTFYLLPTDGSRTATLDGNFAGFIPRSLVDDLSTRA